MSIHGHRRFNYLARVGAPADTAVTAPAPAPSVGGVGGFLLGALAGVVVTVIFETYFDEKRRGGL